MDTLEIRGEGLSSSLTFSFDDLERFHGHDSVENVRELGAKRPGKAVYLRAILDRMDLNPVPPYATFRSPVDDFAASLPLEAIRDSALILYAVDGNPIAPEQGGPFRLLIPGAAPCRTAEIDTCANVKHLSEIELSSAPLEDSRKTPRPHKAGA